MKFALDLTWVRHAKVGGTESFINNLIKGMIMTDVDFEAYLLISGNNLSLFEKYTEDARFHLIECMSDNSNVMKRLIWQHIKLCKMLIKYKIPVLFEPVYDKPFFVPKKIRTVTTIHDLQVLHYPEYQSFLRNLRQRVMWFSDVKTSDCIVCISKYTADDLLKHYKPKCEVKVIHNPIFVGENEYMAYEALEEKYQIKEKKFFYTITGTNPHKNVETIIELMKLISVDSELSDYKLLISGSVNDHAKKLIEQINKSGLENRIIITGFVSNEERNTLLKECACFLYPSLFEGFGMPPIEAMMMGTPTVTTRCTSIPEVTQNRAIYVEEPKNAEEWVNKVRDAIGTSSCIDISEYEPKKIALQYLQVIKNR